MQERVQQRNESTTAYFHSKVRLCHEVNLDFNDTREQVLKGLRSRELCTMLLGRTHDDNDDLLHDILEFERMERERRELFGSRNQSFMTPSFSERSLLATMTREETVDSNHGTDRRQPLPSINQHGERKCYNCNLYGHIARDCLEPKRPLKCQRCQATDHTQRNCQAFSSNESNVVAEALPCTGAGHVLIKEVVFNDDFTLVGLIDTGSSGCLLRASAAARCGIEMVLEPTPLYGFGSNDVPATRSLGHCQAKISIDGVAAEKVPILVVPDDAQSVDLLVGRSFSNLPFVTYCKVGSTFRFYHLNDCPFSGVVPFEQQSKLKFRPREERELQQDTVNYITTSTDRSVTGFHEQCGRHVLLDVQQEEIAEPLCSTDVNAAVIETTSEYGSPVLVDKKNDDKRLAGHQRQAFTKKYRSSNIENQLKISAEEAKRRTTFRDPKLGQRLKKCAFGKESIDSSVSRSTRGRRELTEEKTSDTCKLPKPQTVHDIKRLFRLGSFNRNLTPEARPHR
ncbi:hypothetical protein MTO96_004037 [Rhipicephalus appendiculatus]